MKAFTVSIKDVDVLNDFKSAISKYREEVEAETEDNKRKAKDFQYKIQYLYNSIMTKLEDLQSELIKAQDRLNSCQCTLRAKIEAGEDMEGSYYCDKEEKEVAELQEKVEALKKDIPMCQYLSSNGNDVAESLYQASCNTAGEITSVAHDAYKKLNELSNHINEYLKKNV